MFLTALAIVVIAAAAAELLAFLLFKISRPRD